MLNLDNDKLQIAKDFIYSQKDLYVELQTGLTKNVALAPENGGVGELDKAEFLEKFLTEHGFTNLERFDAPDTRAKGGIRPNLVATIEGENPELNAIWVISHLDVVPTGDLSLWETDPFTVVEKDGKLFGRGVEDNQQGIVSAFASCYALIKNGIKPKHTVKLLFASDEEVGSKYGIIWLIENTKLFNKGDLVIIPDGGDKLGVTIEVAEKNIIWFEFTVNGKQCHGSRPDEGVNACLASNDLSLTLYKTLTKKFSKVDKMFTPKVSTFEPTMRKKNVDGVNIIPGVDVMCMDCRILPCYSCESVIKEVEKIILKIQNKYKVKIEYKLLQKAQSVATDKNASVVKMLKEALKISRNVDSSTIGIGGGTVAAELRNKGFDCVVWGTLDETAHMPNEYCVIENIMLDAYTLFVLMCLE